VVEIRSDPLGCIDAHTVRVGGSPAKVPLPRSCLICYTTGARWLLPDRLLVCGVVGPLTRAHLNSIIGPLLASLCCDGVSVLRTVLPTLRIDGQRVRAPLRSTPIDDSSSVRLVPRRVPLGLARIRTTRWRLARSTMLALWNGAAAHDAQAQSWITSFARVACSSSSTHSPRPLESIAS